MEHVITSLYSLVVCWILLTTIGTENWEALWAFQESSWQIECHEQSALIIKGLIFQMGFAFLMNEPSFKDIVIMEANKDKLELAI